MEGKYILRVLLKHWSLDYGIKISALSRKDILSSQRSQNAFIICYLQLCLWHTQCNLSWGVYVAFWKLQKGSSLTEQKPRPQPNKPASTPIRCKWLIKHLSFSVSHVRNKTSLSLPNFESLYEMGPGLHDTNCSISKDLSVFYLMARASNSICQRPGMFPILQLVGQERGKGVQVSSSKFPCAIIQNICLFVWLPLWLHIDSCYLCVYQK